MENVGPVLPGFDFDFWLLFSYTFTVKGSIFHFILYHMG